MSYLFQKYYMSFILMADIIGSRKKQGKELMNAFSHLTSLVSIQRKNCFLSPITITLGDEFQCVVKTLRDGIEVIILMEELIIRQSLDFKLRYVLHDGTIDTAINRKTAHGMLGLGLTEARQMLNELKGKKKGRILISSSDESQDALLNDCFFIYTGFIDSWNKGDYPVISLFWELKDYKAVGQKLNRDISLLWRKEKSIFIKEYAATKHLIRSII
jgi:hypothetical protein